ncbi:major facilitator superfamily domain-containing protein [Xylariales sp. PMI_506]|nr:major facilitator superfamily domain-containing protein [Xylariales sp. PMI_506]
MDYADDRNPEYDLSCEEAEVCGPVVEQPVAHLSTLRLILLTVGFVGLQIVFSLIFSNGSAFLRSLGLHDSVIALVWLGGPLCGAVLQPYFGLCSEHCRSPWGRRRPYIAGGAAAVVISLLSLAYADAAAAANTTTGARIGAILGTTALNASIQPLQGGLRALLVDASPPHQLAIANAWASRLTSVASVLGYLAGFLDLNGPSSPLGISQFRVLCLFSATAIVGTVTLPCVVIHETPNTQPDTSGEAEITMKEVVSQLSYICTRFHRLPSKAQRICCIQFFAWLAWAPYLFYIALYIGDTYQRQILEMNAQRVSSKRLIQDATRMGSLGLLLFATTALLTGLILPMVLLRRPEQDDEYNAVEKEECEGQKFTKWKQSDPGARIQRVWMWSHVLYATCILSTFLVTSLWGTYILVGLCGISWAVTIWAPFSLISMAISDDEEDTATDAGLSYAKNNERIERRPGIVMALHNTAISAPQIVAVVISSIVFRVCSSSKDVGGSDSGIIWTLRITALSAIVAAVIARKGF